ncbi:outer membrane putative beta-barrel porin/alpha-amylase [Neolewinella xylanilytica]|uniref:Outer membrane putative beta-barrel porin/alpha-amylase n=1 Tax=Neolewinella xylanilytica TaxID=1514080 RepID=A0A2S6I8F5_9BACT|nr:transporter [Neolewinella xylanilytica]PPK87768.1 outer membrane putative beta-barrel porin/alpha-amylase [Neolewinella xylanilytica]
MPWIPIVCLLLLTAYLPAQYSPTIVSGRPGQSINAATVGRGVYQVQTGLNLDWAREGRENLFDLSEVTDIRVGVFERLELSALIIGEADESTVAPRGTRRDRGISDTQLGGRYLFLENDGWRPAIAVRAHALLRAQDEDFRRERVGANLILAADWAVTDLLAFTANLSRTWPGDGSRSDDYVATLGFNLSDRWSSFVEVYGTMTGVATANYDGGFAYLVNDNLGLDLSVGWDGDYGVRSYFLDFGVSFRVDDH